MEDLIRRLETAEVGSRELDRAVVRALGFVEVSDPRDAIECWRGQDGMAHYATHNVTTSLDSALALAERVGWRAYMADFSIPGSFSWMIKSFDDISVTNPVSGEHYTGPDFKSGRGNTPALAICIAILKAKQQETK